MNKIVNFCSFYNDFNVSNINCVDLTNATYLGRKNTNLYYFYCFLYVIYNNFNCSNLSAREAVFETLGFKEDFKRINSYEDLVNEIKAGIDKDEPLIVFFKYRSLFYYRNYKNVADRKHTCLICSEYNDETKVIGILDMLLSRKNLYSVFTGEFYNVLPLTNNMFEEMWNLSRSCFIADNQPNFIEYNAYSLKKIKEPMFSSLKEIVKYYIDALSTKEDKLIEELKSFNTKIASIKKNYSEILMQKYGISMYVITETLRKYFTNQFVDDPDFFDYLHHYYKNRRTHILKISKNIIRGKAFSDEELEYFISSIKNDNQKLLELVSKHFNENLNNNAIEYANYTYNASIFADSELRPASTLLNDNSMNESHYWVSRKAGTVHWLKLDLHEIKNIKRIKIKHYGEKNFNTKEFILSGSVDDDEWEEISHESNNQNNLSIYDINSSFRYIKIEIIIPCERDYYARIKEFSVYGD